MNCITIKAFRNGNLGDVTITEESFYQMMDTFLNEKTTNGFIKPIDFLAETVENGVAKTETININPIEQASEIRTFIHNATTTAYNKLLKDFEVKVEDFTKRIEESVSNDQLNALQNEINALDLKYKTTEKKTKVAKQLDRLINAKQSVIEKADFIKNNLIVDNSTTVEDVQNALNNGVNIVVKSNQIQPKIATNFTNHSGGAFGGDTAWDVIGREFGVVNHRHYREPGQSTVDSSELRANGVKAIAISAEDFKEGGEKATAAATVLGRRISASGAKYQFRNWAQVKYSDAVFAVTTMVKPGEKDKKGYNVTAVQAEGGTGYAVQMAIAEGKPVYVFDQNRNKWFKNINGKWEDSETPVLTKNFAGVGTRELNENGKQAIREVYEKTFKSQPISNVQADTDSAFTEIQNYLTEKNVQFEEKEVNGELVKVYKSENFTFRNLNNQNAEVIEFVKTNPNVKKEDTLNEGQKEAVTKALKILNDVQHDDIYEDMFLLSGKGGTGKTYTTEVILSKTKKSGMTSHVAPTWNAVNEILKASPDNYSAITLASFLGTELSEPDENGVEKFILFDDEKLEKLKKAGMLPAVFTSSLFVLDECSMLGGNNQKPKLDSEGKLVSSDVWQALLYRLDQRKRMGYGRPSKILFIGDYAQIPPVGTEPDKDAFIVEKLTEKETTHHVLTENMRTGKKDLSVLHEIYRKEIDKAIESVKKGIPSNTSVRANPIPFTSRVNSENLTWENDINRAVENFVKFYNQDVFNVTNVVFVNYNTYTRPETQNLIKLIRTKLFGSNSTRLYNEKELVLLKGNLKAEIVNAKNLTEEVVFRNETRFILQDIVSNKTEEIEHTFKVWNTVNRGYDYKTIKLTLKGSSAKFTTQYGKQTVSFNSFIPDAGVFESIFGNYDKVIKGYHVDGMIIPYGAAKDIKESYPTLQYGYVVNGHKVQGSSYNHTFVDEANILRAGNLTNKEKLNSLYTAASRPKFTLTMVNESQPALPAWNPDQERIDELEKQLKLVNKPSQEYDAIELELNCLKK